MGLIKAAVDSTKGFFADQWKEYFYCDSMESDVLVKIGEKRKGSNKGSDNIISNGSVIAVNEGQCMIIVDQGKIVELCAEAGEFVYETSSEPSFFSGSLEGNIMGALESIGSRISFGGAPGKDQRVYFFNTKEMMGNKYGTPNAIPFRVVDTKIDLDIDIAIKCFGEYSYKIVNPVLFYTNVCGNIDYEFKTDEIAGQLKSELLTALQPAFAKISEMGIRYSSLTGHTMEIADKLNEVLSKKWCDTRGIVIHSFGMNSVKASEEDEAMLKELQKTSVFRNSNMAAAHLVGAQADAMKSAAKNSAGAMMGFAGMNMATQAGGMNAQSLFAMGQQNPAPAQQQAPIQSGWTCTCGATNTGKFCAQCGSAKPAPTGSWTCSCGAVNTGKFCAECGKPHQVKTYKCDKCGWQPTDPNATPKFCPECGDIFDENDM